MEEIKIENNTENLGVQAVKIENNHYVVTVVWKDGKKNERVFPQNGFPVVDPITKKELGHISGEEALSILKQHSVEYDADNFSWLYFV